MLWIILFFYLRLEIESMFDESYKQDIQLKLVALLWYLNWLCLNLVAKVSDIINKITEFGYNFSQYLISIY